MTNKRRSSYTDQQLFACLHNANAKGEISELGTITNKIFNIILL